MDQWWPNMKGGWALPSPASLRAVTLGPLVTTWYPVLVLVLVPVVLPVAGSRVGRYYSAVVGVVVTESHGLDRCPHCPGAEAAELPPLLSSVRFRLNFDEGNKGNPGMCTAAGVRTPDPDSVQS